MPIDSTTTVVCKTTRPTVCARIPQLMAHADCRLLVTAQRKDMLLSTYDRQKLNLSPDLIRHTRLAAAVLDSYFPLPADAPREPVTCCPEPPWAPCMCARLAQMTTWLVDLHAVTA